MSWICSLFCHFTKLNQSKTWQVLHTEQDISHFHYVLSYAIFYRSNSKLLSWMSDGRHHNCFCNKMCQKRYSTTRFKTRLLKLFISPLQNRNTTLLQLFDWLFYWRPSCVWHIFSLTHLGKANSTIKVTICVACLTPLEHKIKEHMNRESDFQPQVKIVPICG